ncbi:MAG: hypothetical protein M0Z66_11195 [Thermaerobacter sp.]|nr:hypothetical protein [Thermaerobacter sp.]
MKTRQEILHIARALADAVSDSSELQELQRCEAELGELLGADFSEYPDDPRVVAYAAAKERAERLIHQVTSVFLFPLTGSLQPAQTIGVGGCSGCQR